MQDFSKNVHGWKPSEDDYRLIFREVNGLWVEITNNLPGYFGMTLADYMSQMGLTVPYGTQFCRIQRDDLDFEYRDMHSYVRIDVKRMQ